MFLAPLALGESTIGVVISPLNALVDQQVQIYILYVHVYTCTWYYLPSSFDLVFMG